MNAHDPVEMAARGALARAMVIVSGLAVLLVMGACAGDSSVTTTTGAPRTTTSVVPTTSVTATSVTATSVTATTAAPDPTTRPSPPTTATPPATTVVPAPPDAGPATGSVQYLALGDSYTIGQSVDFAERWPVQLAALLRSGGVEIADPEFIAMTGWTTDELLRAMDETMPQGPYDLVSLQIGVNNQFNGGDVEVFRTEFADVLDRTIELAGGEAGRVLVLSIPNWGVTPFAPDGLRGRISFEVGLFNDVVIEEAAARGVRFADVTENSEKAGDDPAYLSFDELHPSGLMYAEWAEMVFPEALAALGADGG